jgi:hypothetical protein
MFAGRYGRSSLHANARSGRLWRRHDMTAMEGFDAAIERYHLAAADFINGDAEPYKDSSPKGKT